MYSHRPVRHPAEHHRHKSIVSLSPSPLGRVRGSAASPTHALLRHSPSAPHGKFAILASRLHCPQAPRMRAVCQPDKAKERRETSRRQTSLGKTSVARCSETISLQHSPTLQAGYKLLQSATQSIPRDCRQHSTVAQSMRLVGRFERFQMQPP